MVSRDNICVSLCNLCTQHLCGCDFRSRPPNAVALAVAEYCKVELDPQVPEPPSLNSPFEFILLKGKFSFFLETLWQFQLHVPR